MATAYPPSEREGSRKATWIFRASEPPRKYPGAAMPSGREASDPQALAQLLFSDIGGLQFGYQGPETAGDRPWVVEVGEVARPGENLQTAPGHGPVGVAAMFYRDHGVPSSPDDQARHLAREVEPVARAHTLSERVNHRTQRVQEGATAPSVAERGIPASDLGEVIGRPEPETHEQRADGLPRAQDGARS